MALFISCYMAKYNILMLIKFNVRSKIERKKKSNQITITYILWNTVYYIYTYKLIFPIQLMTSKKMISINGKNMYAYIAASFFCCCYIVAII